MFQVVHLCLNINKNFVHNKWVGWYCWEDLSKVDSPFMYIYSYGLFGKWLQESRFEFRIDRLVKES